MSKENFESLKTVIETLDEKLVKEPAIPVAISLQEAEDLMVWCQPDKIALTKAGLDWGLVESLPARTGALRYAQSIWQEEYRSIEDAQKEWAAMADEAYNLRDELVHHFLHAYRNSSDLLAKTQRIAEGAGHADMIQDLADLAVLGQANIAPLKAIHMDVAMLDKAAQWSDKAANLLAKANGLRMSDNKKKITRDRAYAYLKIAVDEIRQHGQYIHWRTPERMKGYASQYLRVKKAKASASVKEETA